MGGGVTEPFWQKAILEAIGPLVAAIVGTIIIGGLAGRIARKSQSLREAHQLRIALVTKMTRAASALYFETQRYWRARDRENADSTRMHNLRADLDAQYTKSRVAGEVLESRLRVFFKTERVWKLWHATMDLITVRYFRVIGLATDQLLRNNAGNDHSGLSVEQLSDVPTLLDEYRRKLQEATRAALEEGLIGSLDARAKEKGATEGAQKNGPPA